MTDKRFVHIHLSTAVVLIFLTAILLCVNVYRVKEHIPALLDQSQVSPAEFARNQIARNRESDLRLKYGWPVTAAQEVPVIHPRQNDPDGVVDIIDELAWHPSGIAIDAAVALAILFGFAFFLERRVRQRA